VETKPIFWDSCGVMAVTDWGSASRFDSDRGRKLAAAGVEAGIACAWVVASWFAPLAKRTMQKHIKARKIRAPKIHTKSTNVSSLWLMMSTFRFLPVFRVSYNMILNFKTPPIWLLVARWISQASNELLLESVLMYPVCGFAKRETMSTDACRCFYQCAG